MAGRGKRHRIFAWLGICLGLLVLVPHLQSISLANQGPFRITHQASPEAVTKSVAADPAAPDTSIKVPAAPALDEGSSGPNVRTRSDRAGSDVIPVALVAEASPVDDENEVPRLNEPVLRWLPEIMASSEKWGVPPEIVAGMIRIESQGEPGPISPSGARGLVQMMPDGLRSYGAPESLWHDPVTNIDAGAWGLAWRFTAQGSWEGAIGAYLGFGCDAWGTCTDVYIRVVMGWAAYYKPIIENPRGSGIPLLPKDWAYGPITILPGEPAAGSGGATLHTNSDADRDRRSNRNTQTW